MLVRKEGCSCCLQDSSSFGKGWTEGGASCEQGQASSFPLQILLWFVRPAPPWPWEVGAPCPGHGEGSDCLAASPHLSWLLDINQKP